MLSKFLMKLAAGSMILLEITFESRIILQYVRRKVGANVHILFQFPISLMTARHKH